MASSLALVPNAIVRSRRDLAIASIVTVWVALALTLDVGVGIWPQRAIGAITWVLLATMLRGESPAVRSQIAVCVLFATAIEYTASPLLGFYTYRLANVPAFVPPGHGLVYFAALALGRSDLFTTHRRLVSRGALVVAGAWALWGVTIAGRHDMLGFLAYLLLVRFVLVGQAPSVYAAAFLVTGFLELFGTSVGTWRWSMYDPTRLVSIGNPPSGISGAYCVIDAVALAGGPLALRLVEWLRTRSWRRPLGSRLDEAWHPPRAQAVERNAA